MRQSMYLRISHKARLLISFIRQKVDLTKYTAQYAFTFDHVFDCHTSNQSVSIANDY